MFINNISASRSDIIDQCLWKYYLRYVIKIPGLESPNEESLNFGSFIHKVFELGFNSNDMKELAKISESVRSTYKIPTRENDRIHRCIKNFVSFNQKLGETIATELSYSVPLDSSNDITHIGVIDRVIKGTDGGYLVIDYKTSKREKSRKDLMDDKQLKGYAYAIHNLYDVPYEKIHLAHYYPLTNNLITVKFTKFQVDIWKRKEIDKVWRIRKKKTGEFYAQENVFCNYCEYKKACPKFCSKEEVDQRIDEQKKLANVSKSEENKNGSEDNKDNSN